MILQTAVGGRVIIVVKRVIRQSVVLQPNAKNHVLFVGVLIIILNSVQRARSVSFARRAVIVLRIALKKAKEDLRVQECV